MTIKIGRAAVGQKFLRHNDAGTSLGHTYTVLRYIRPGEEFQGLVKSRGRYVADSYYRDGTLAAFSSDYYMRGARLYLASQALPV